MSSLAWLDFSEDDRRRALEVIEKFRDRDTVDELGIGTVRDAFADLFFPGTSVIHSRARYFFFIPWTYLRLEKKRTPSEKIAAEARRAEISLIEVLLSSGDGEGTIGRRARTKLKILPSAIYWQALQRLQIRLYPGSRDQYHRSIDRFYRRSADRVVSDDGELLSASRLANWNPRLPPAPDGFPNEATMSLRVEEAEFLRDQIVFVAPNSFYRFMVDEERPDLEADYPWNYSGLGQLPRTIQDQVSHARNFSAIIHGAPLLYNLILSEKCGDGGGVESYRGALDEWRAVCEDRSADMLPWRTAKFWDVVSSGGTKISARTRAFVDTWIEIVSAVGFRGIPDSPGARRLIYDRERQLKGAQARVDNQRARELWTGASGTRRISYRWDIALTTVRDICDGRLGRVKDA